MASRSLEFGPASGLVDRDGGWDPAVNPPAVSVEEAGPRALTGRRIGRRVAIAGMAQIVLAAGALQFLRTRYQDRVFPSVYVADVPVGGLTFNEAAAAVGARAAAVEQNPVIFSYDNREWKSTFGELGVKTDPDAALSQAIAVGREDDAWDRIRSTVDLARENAFAALPITFDQSKLAAWFDRIDTELGLTPKDASLAISGTSVQIVPEQDGTIVDRAAATDLIMHSLTKLSPLSSALPVAAHAAAVRAGDLNDALNQLRNALANPVQVSFGKGLWTLPSAGLSPFVTQTVDPAKTGAAAFSLGMDETKLSAWLDEQLSSQINRDASDATVGWDGEKLVSVVESVDGLTLDVDALAARVSESFLTNQAAIVAPVKVTKPDIDSGNLGALGIDRLLGSGSSNYAGSTTDRATNLETGASLLNGTLVPPHGTFSFNGAIGLIDESKGFVDAQVIDGEKIGRDVGGGICQVSTTVFRAAYFAGFPIGDWWPHRFRIAFYELDNWPPGLDASILQPDPDPSTWADFTFENPTDHWVLVESWANGVNAVVNLYGGEVDWEVHSFGPTFGKKTQALKDSEVVDDTLEPGTIVVNQVAGLGVEVTHYRKVVDGDDNVLWEGNFYTLFSPKGNVWKVSPDMKGKSPSDPDRAMTPVVQDPAPTTMAREFEPGVTPPSDWNGEVLDLATDMEVQPTTDASSGGDSGSTWTDTSASTDSGQSAPDAGAWQDPNAAQGDSNSWQDPNAASQGDDNSWQDPNAGATNWQPSSSDGTDQGG